MKPVIPVRNAACVLAAVLASGIAVQAEAPEEAVARCAMIATVGDRILCLETALRQYANTDTEIVVDWNLSQPEPEVVAPPRAAAAPAVSASPAAPVPTAEPEPAAAASSIELGAEQIAGRNRVASEENVHINAAIVDHEVVGYGSLRLTLDNGQVWQQTTDDDRNTARFLSGEDEVRVEMWQSRSGGYRMHLIPFNRTLRVRRLK